MALRLIERSILFEGAKSPGPSHNLAFASLLACPDGSLLVAYRCGQHKNSADGTQRLARSRDNGHSWTSERFPFAVTPAGQAGEFRTAALSLVSPSRIAMLLTWIDHPDSEVPICNPTTEGLLPVHIGWASSEDNGATWSALREISPHPFSQPVGNGPMVRLADRRLLIAFEIYKPYDDPTPWSARSAVIFSGDDGQSWGSPQIVGEDPEHARSYWDQHVHRLRDGRLAGFCWVDDRRNQGNGGIHVARSSDDGRTWAKPQPIGVAGQFSTYLELADGRSLLIYVLRGGAPSIRARIGQDGGERWDTSEDILIYTQGQDDLAKVNGRPYADYLQGMRNWSFGWPTAVQLSNGQILVCYYTGEGDRSSIAMARMEVI